MQKPLAGIRVLAVENFIAGPFGSMWLADAGAEVVKIETRDAGDYSRATSPRKADEQDTMRSLSFLRSNRNKKSLTLDLKHADGKQLFRRLVAEADVLLENLRPGAMDKLGLGWNELREVNPRLVYVAISGFGHADVLASPYSDHPAFDIMGQALSGLMNRPERQGERPIYLGFPLADIQAGILGAYGAMLALFQRQLTGVGKKVDISMYDASLALNELSVIMYSATGKSSKPGAHALSAPFGAYRASDGWIVIAVLGEHIWARFCRSIGRPGLLDDPRFGDGVLRHQHHDALEVEIQRWLSPLPRAQAVEILLAGGVPASVVNDVDDVFACPHVSARQMLQEFDDPAWGKVRVAGNPVKLSDVPETRPTHPPDLGQNTDEILRSWIGLAPEEVASLRQRQVV